MDSLFVRRRGRILSNPPFMSSRSVEAFIPAFWEAMTSCLSERTAAVVDMLGRDPHWFLLKRPRLGPSMYSLSATSFSRIFDRV